MLSSLTAHALVALLINGIALGGVGLAGALLFGQAQANRHRWIVGALAVAITGYAVFWFGFWQPRAGRAVAWLVLAAAAGMIVWRRGEAKGLLRLAAPVAV